jgi:hypothetical protein
MGKIQSTLMLLLLAVGQASAEVVQINPARDRQLTIAVVRYGPSPDAGFEQIRDQIDLEIREGKERYRAVVDAGGSRLRPVSVAAAATILGMVPLLQDAFFISMAVTIMVGLLFATVLTLIIVPVLYTIFFRIPNPQKVAAKS